MQSSGKITRNGTEYTLGNKYNFVGSVSGKASSDGSGATAMCLDELAGSASDYKKNFYPQMRLMYYNEGAAYPYCLYYPVGFWGGSVHGWFPESIFPEAAEVKEETESGTEGTQSIVPKSHTITPPVGGTATTCTRLKSRYKKDSEYLQAAVYIKPGMIWKKGTLYIKDNSGWQ